MCKAQSIQEDGENGKLRPYTYDEAVELTGNGRYHYFLLATCCIISKAVGLDMFGFAIIVTVAKCDLQLGLTETGVLASAPFAGIIFAYPWGYYADICGRRKALLLSTIGGFIFAAICSISPSWQLMTFFKVVSCSFSSASITLTMTLLGECTGSAHRNKYLFIMNSINLLSDTFSFGLAYLLLPLEFSLPITFLGINFRPWRLYTLVLALPLGMGGLMMLYLHESPKFLASRGDNETSLKVLRSIYKRNGGKEDEFPVKQLVITDAVVDQKLSFWRSIMSLTIPVFKPPLLWRTLQLAYLMVVCLSTNNAFVMWFPTMVNIFFTKLAGKWSDDKTFCNRLFEKDNVGLPVNNTITDNLLCDDTISNYTVFSGMVYGVFFCSLTLVLAMMTSHRKIVFIFWLTVAGVSCSLMNITLLRLEDSVASEITGLRSLNILASRCNAPLVRDDTISNYTVFSGMVYGVFFCSLTLILAMMASHRKIVFIFWLAVAGISCSLMNITVRQLEGTLLCDDTISNYTVFSGMVYGVFFCSLTLVVAMMASHRKIVFIFWLAVAGVSCFLVNLFQPAASLAFFVLLQTTPIALPSLGSYLIDLYPTSCRGIVGSIGMTVTRLCSLAAVNLVGAVITDYCAITFYAWAGFVFSGIVVALFLPPDKKLYVTKL